MISFEVLSEENMSYVSIIKMLRFVRYQKKKTSIQQELKN